MSHGHSHAHGPGHAPSAHGHAHQAISFEDGESWTSLFESEERDSYMHPDEIVAQLVAPRVAAGPCAITDVGAGTGWLAFRLARSFPAATILAVDAASAMVQLLTRRATQLGLTNVQPVLTDQGNLILPSRASVAVFCMSYHHLESDRVEYLRHFKQHCMLAKGHVVLLEFYKNPTLPPDLQAIVCGPPAWMRVDKADVVAEFERAGFQLVQEADFLIVAVYGLVFEAL
jgi:SAM-dependent methyltransferase